MAELELIKGDYGYNIVFTLTDSSGTAVSLAGTPTIKFKMSARGASTLKIDGTCTISDAAGGICYYTLVAEDTNTVGVYNGEVEATWAAPAKVLTWKIDRILIESDLP